MCAVSFSALVERTRVKKKTICSRLTCWHADEIYVIKLEISSGSGNSGNSSNSGNGGNSGNSGTAATVATVATVITVATVATVATVKSVVWSKF